MTLSRFGVACATLVVLGASPAAAAFGSRSTAILPLKLTANGIPRGSKTHTCQAGGSDRAATASRSAVIGTAHKTAVVACEQPPRSQLLDPQALDHAAANALAALG